jgi:DNA-binding CsgD family transcriptional regulator
MYPGRRSMISPGDTPGVTLTKIRMFIRDYEELERNIGPDQAEMLRRRGVLILEALTPAEVALLNNLAFGHDYRRISEIKKYKFPTVKGYFSKVFKKIGAHSRTEAMYFWQSEIFRAGMQDLGILVTPPRVESKTLTCTGKNQEVAG